jgi:multidrug efflux pump subunit AcrA (membrane-fusion protein)
MRRNLAIAAVVVALAGTTAFRYYKKAKAAEAGAAELAAAEKGDLENHFLDSGEITPKVFVDVAAKVSGRVTEIPVEEGQRVEKGQKLAVIQPGRTEAEKFVPLTVTAPISGIVMRYQKVEGSSNEDGKIAKVGDYVSGLLDTASPTYLMTVADLTKLIVKMKISEMDVLKLKEGMPVTVTIDAVPNEKLAARVTLISPKAERDKNDLKNFKVEVTLAKGDSRLKPGMTARVDGLLEAHKGVLKIPLTAVFEEKGKEYAYIKTDDKPKKTELKLGLRSELEAEVLSGVAAGDKLLTEKPEDKPKLP